MKKHKDLDIVMNLIAARGHAAPTVELLKGELRSDYGFEPTPQPPASANGLVNIQILWRYRLLTGKRQDFAVFLQGREEAMATAVTGLGVGVKYLGTFAVLPNALLWQTIWTYDDTNAIDAFKQKLIDTGNTQLKKDVKKLASFVDPTTLEIERLALARSVVAPAIGGTIDPILALFGD